jgi:hypothetical protein
MSTFRFYITDLFNGQVVGTNDEAKAMEFTSSEDYFVVDSQTSEWVTTDGREEVTEA